MFDRATLKERAKAAFQANYWMCVVVALILAWAGGQSSGSSYRSSYNFNNNSSSYNSENLDWDELQEIIEDPSHGDYGDVFANRGFWTAFTGAFLLVFFIILIISIAFTVFVKNPLMVGCKRFFTINAFEKPKFEEVGFGFRKGQYLNIVKVEFMKNLFIFLWSLLLIIPGIIKSYEYYMVDYILTEDPTIGYKEALEMSSRMMDGNKWATFVLELSFIGWLLLSGCTCLIAGVFYVFPYMYATFSELFLTLRSNYFGPSVKPYHVPAFQGGYGGGQPYNAGQQYNAGQPYNAGQQYGAPQQPYNAGQQYGAPQQPYNAGQQYGAPQQPYNAPQQPGIPQDTTPANDYYNPDSNPYGNNDLNQ